MEKQIKRAYVALVVGVLAVSTSAIFVKLSTAPASIIAFYRLFFTALIFFFPTLIYYHKDLKNLTRKELIYAVLAGVFLAFHFITWFQSLKFTSVASSVVLVTIQPVFAMIGTYIFFKEVPSKIGVIGLILAIIGSIVIGWGDFRIGDTALLGDLLAILGAFLVTLYWLIGQELRKKQALLPYTFLVYTTSSITLFIYNTILDYDFLGYETKDWSIFLALAIIPTIFGHTVFNWSIRYVSATTVSMAILAEPLGAIILAYIILGEGINTTQILGGLVIVTGIIIYLKKN